jgi:hypothetical protein
MRESLSKADLSVAVVSVARGGPLVCLALLIGAAALPLQAIAGPASNEPAVIVAAPLADPLVIVVSLRKQRLSVFNKNGTVATSPISSGTSEFPTPTGVFSVIGKEVEHESNIYEGAAMPFMQRLTWTGTAMHAGNLPGYPASHGCIRLPYNFSEKLFGMTNINTRVIVTREDAVPYPISHAKLFAPLVGDAAQPTDQPVANALTTTKVASLSGMSASPAPPPAVVPPGQLPLNAKAVARFAETAALNSAVRPMEASRNGVWDRVKTANRAVEAARSDVSGLQNTINEAQRIVDKAKRAKQGSEDDLAYVMAKADKARTVKALDALALAEQDAETKLLGFVEKFDSAVAAVQTLKSGLPRLTETLKTAEAARRALDEELRTANLNLKNAQSAYSLAKREDIRYMKPVSVLVSRKTGRLYVRQGFEPVLEVPIVIDRPDQPLGTHVFTAMATHASGKALSWQVVSLGAPSVDDDQPRRSKREREAAEAKEQQRPIKAALKALDRLQFPPEALEAISERVKAGSTLLISDDGTSQYFGNGTDFVVNVR